MTIEDITKYENQTVSVIFKRRPFKGTLSYAINWSHDEVDFPIYRGLIAKHVTGDKVEWMLCNNFIGDPRLRVVTDPSTRGGYNHAMALTPTVIMNIKNIS